MLHAHGRTLASVSRAFRPFDDFLLPPEIFEARQRKDELGLAISGRFEEWRAERVGLLESRLQEIDEIASAGKLAEAVSTAEGLSISPMVAGNKGDSGSFSKPVALKYWSRSSSSLW